MASLAEDWQWTHPDMPGQPLWTLCGKRLGLSHATEIQRRTWPLALQKRDLLAIAPTGGGKTLAFLLPAACHSGPALILSPTRELAAQTFATATRAFGSDVPCALVIGGRHDAALAQKAAPTASRIVIGTPGKVLDRYAGHVFHMVVLDEADALISSLEEQLDQIFPTLVSSPQVLMFSATNITKYASYCPDPVRISVGVHIIRGTHTIHVCAAHKRPRLLLRFLSRDLPAGCHSRQRPAIIVFCKRIATVTQISALLRQHRITCRPIHSHLPQRIRDQNLVDFRAGKAQVLVATDVAARGLHIKNLLCCVNYDFPTNINTFVHRIGRLGRSSGGDPISLSLFTRNLAKLAPDVIALLRVNHQHLPSELLALAAAAAPVKEATVQEAAPAARQETARQVPAPAASQEPPAPSPQSVDPVLAALRAVASLPAAAPSSKAKSLVAQCTRKRGAAAPNTLRARRHKTARRH